MVTSLRLSNQGGLIKLESNVIILFCKFIWTTIVNPFTNRIDQSPCVNLSPYPNPPENMIIVMHKVPLCINHMLVV